MDIKKVDGICLAFDKLDKNRHKKNIAKGFVNINDEKSLIITKSNTVLYIRHFQSFIPQ